MMVVQGSSNGGEKVRDQGSVKGSNEFLGLGWKNVLISKSWGVRLNSD